ncbi:MAG: hypothetical protein J6Z31_01555 [Fibrobacter sp.]|nr:hypothetical protein [Fibrobacter sp.]
MLRSWTYKLIEKRFYCAECGAISPHSIFSREPFSLHAGVPFGVPLVCQCKNCQSFFVAFSQEVYFGTYPFNAEYAKLLSQNRLAPNDWVYVDGKARPGRISALYATQNEEVIELDFGGTSREKFTRPVMTTFNERAPLGFKLLPAQAGVALYGDPVYHVLRKMMGFVVGFVSDKGKEKLVVQLESGKVLFITLADEFQLVPDDILLSRLRESVLGRFPQMESTLRLNVVHSVAYVYGSVATFPEKNEVLQFVKRMPDFRGVVDLISVQLVGEPVSDAELLHAAKQIVEREDSPLFMSEVSAENGCVTLNAYFTSGSDVQKIKTELSHIKGLQNIKITFEEAPPPSPQMRHMAEVLRAKISRIPAHNAHLRVIPTEEGLLVEGSVRNFLQKSFVNLLISRNTKDVYVQTHIRVDNSQGEI